ncbi:MAG: hypothetical protein WCI72_01715 [archaeon]
MVEVTEVAGTKIAEYGSVQEFTKALKLAKPRRIHTFYSGGVVLFGNPSWQASFVDSNNIAHGFIVYGDESKEIKKAQAPIYGWLAESKLKEVDGMITVSKRNGDIYNVFRTDSPSQEERVAHSYTDWIAAVKELPRDGTLIQYLPDGSSIVLDATHGKNHLVTMIEKTAGRSLEEALAKINSVSSGEVEIISGKGYQTRDNTSFVNWFLDLKE